MESLKQGPRKVKVEFLPEGQSVLVPPGTLVLDAAAQAGVPLVSPCGAQGRCGRCLVRVEHGEVTRAQNPHLSAKQVGEGWALACVTQIVGDVALHVPPQRERERVVVQAAATRKAAAVRCEWPRYPAVRRFYLELPKPSLEDSSSDLERLKKALAVSHGIEEVHVVLPVMKGLTRELRQADWKVTVTVDAQEGGATRIVDIQGGHKESPLLGLAVDIGTTNVWIDLVDLSTGRSLDRVSTLNRQVSRGEDVISRIIYSQRGNGLEELRQLVLDTINNLIAELAIRHKFEPREMQGMVVAGNTTMVHLLLGLPARHIREEPYVPSATHFPVYTAAEVGVNINPFASVYCVPAVAAYVGGDITAGVLSSCLFESKKLTLFLDVGTNGEIVMGDADWMTTCACSAGPAFEGAGMRFGMRATKGAIEDVTMNSTTLEPTLRVIGNVAPVGICGSGLLSALAEMLLTGVVDRSGRMNMGLAREQIGAGSRLKLGDHGAEYVLVWARDSGIGEDIVLSEVDVNNLLRTKAAIYAGIAVMARNVGVALEDVEEVLIGGSFGQHINVEKAIQVGMLPDLPWDRFKFLGNTSLAGAYNILLSRHARVQADEVARRMTYFELVADNTFMDEFTAAMFLPHTDLSRFPSVAALLEKQAGAGVGG
ncbi:MAG: ASKHA domain-containing protein [Chloroflexota bacterium]